MDELKHFQHCLTQIPQACYPLHSRIHPLRSFAFPFTKCYVKRDDELGFGISGSKIRKYRSLIPFFLSNNIKEVIVIGSAYSNHVLSFVQLLIENGLLPTLFLRGDPTRPLQGNSLLLSLFIPSSSIHWFSKLEWKNVELKAYTYAKEQTHGTFVLPEGGACSEAFPGALTLPLDVIHNEGEMKLNFDHFFIEAGTGFTASALILGLHWLKHPVCVHVILLADDEKAFLIRLKECHTMFHQFIQYSSPFPQNFVIHYPQISKKFGKISPSLFRRITQIAQQEGFLTDPLYSAKLFIETEHLLAQGNIQGHACIHHAGGSLTLMGFEKQLKEFSTL